eukprot:237629_1
MAVVCKRENILETLEGCSSLVQDRLLNHITSYQHNLHRLQMNMNKDLEQSIVQILDNASVIKEENGCKHHHKIKELFKAQSCLLNDIYAKSNDMMMSCFKKAHFLHNQLHHKWYNTFIVNRNADTHTTQMDIDSVIKTEPNDCVEQREAKHESITPSTSNQKEQTVHDIEHANDGMNAIQDNNDNRISRYQCSHCTERLESINRFENHNWFEHEDTKPWKCNECDRAYKSHTGLYHHRKTHNKDGWVKCDQCNYSCAEKWTLKKHKRTHSGEKPFHCDECDYSCKLSTYLVRHKRTHSDERPLQCDQCDYSCKQRTDLKRHKTTHSGEKPFDCDECGKSFARKYNLTRHKRLHSGEKPFKCIKCGKKFSARGTCNRHQNKHCKK